MAEWSTIPLSGSSTRGQGSRGGMSERGRGGFPPPSMSSSQSPFYSQPSSSPFSVSSPQSPFFNQPSSSHIGGFPPPSMSSQQSPFYSQPSSSPFHSQPSQSMSSTESPFYSQSSQSMFSAQGQSMSSTQSPFFNQPVSSQSSRSSLPSSVSEFRPLGQGMLMERNRSLKVMVYCWNEESVQFAPRVRDEDMKKYFGGTLSTWLYSGANGALADFVLDWTEEINNQNPDIVFFAFQEAQDNDRLSDEALVHEMNRINYVVLKSTSLTGIGVTTFKYSSAGHTRGLRNVVFVKRDMVDTIAKDEALMRTNMGDNYQKYYSLDQFRSKGGLVSFVRFPGYGPIALVNCHLPFNSSTLMTYKKSKDIFARKIGVLETDLGYNTIIRELIWMNSTPALQGDIYRPEVIILCGDLNYRVTIPPDELKAGYDVQNDWEIYLDRYHSCDEYRQEKNNGNIYPMSEGVERKGPQFYPTDKMVKGRNAGDTSLASYNLGKDKQRQPSWTDRILYNTTPNSKLQVQCISYDRMDIGNMKLSDHAGVKAIFNIYSS